jgi:hypothetical protein
MFMCRPQPWEPIVEALSDLTVPCYENEDGPCNTVVATKDGVVITLTPDELMYAPYGRCGWSI